MSVTHIEAPFLINHGLIVDSSDSDSDSDFMTRFNKTLPLFRIFTWFKRAEITLY
jgi:hypothetical protein